MHPAEAVGDQPVARDLWFLLSTGLIVLVVVIVIMFFLSAA